MYHCASHLHPAEGQAPKYAQLYVLDSAQANRQRMSLPYNQDCSADTMQQLDVFLRVNNIYAKTYKMMLEIEQEQIIQAGKDQSTLPNISMYLRNDRRGDKTYDLPTASANEIAMIFTTVNGEPPVDRDIQIYARNPTRANTIKLDIKSPNLEPMVYALLFPLGEPGWQPYMPGLLEPTRNISILQWKVAHTAVRDYFNPVMRAGKLTQQWLVDSFLQVEGYNLEHIKEHQTEMKVNKILLNVYSMVLFIFNDIY